MEPPLELRMDGPARRPSGPSPFVDPSMVGPHVWLRPLDPGDVQLLYQYELGGGPGAHWRLHGATPSLDQHARTVWEGVLATFAVTGKDSGRPLGVVSLYNPSMENGVAFLAAVAFPFDMGTGLVVEGVGLFLDYCFAHWALRKIIIDAVETNLPHYGSVIGRVFTEEGRLRQLHYHDERYWDRVFLTLDRSRWLDQRTKVMPFLRGREEGRRA